MLEELKKTLGRVGYALLWLVALGGLAHAQMFILGGKNVVVAIFELITAVLLSVWLLRREEKSVGLLKAMAFGGVLVVYHWLLLRSSLRWDPNYGISMLAIMTGQVLVFTLHSPFWIQPVPERKIDSHDPQVRRTQMAVYLGVTLLSMILVIVLGKKYLSMYDFTGVMNWFFVYRWDGIIGDIPSATFKAWGKLWMPLAYIAVLVGSFSYILKAQEKLGVWKSLLWIYVLGNVGGLVLVTLADAGIWSLVLQVKSVHFHFYGVAKSFKSFHELWAMVGTYASKEMFQYVSFPGTHPPFAIILNWLLIQITGDNIMLIGILLGALAWTGVFPMYLLGRELYNREMGYYMAGLYLVMPSTLILNHVTLDALTASLVAWALAFVVMGSRRKTSGWMFVAGLAVAGVAATNYSTPLVIPAMFLLALMGLRDQGKWAEGFGAWMNAAAVKCALFFLGIGLPYALILWTTQGKFDYLAMMEHTISATRQGVAQHPWFVGGWMCWFEYFIHIGVVVTALFLVRWREIFRGDWRNDVLPWAGLVTLMVPFVLGAGRQETEREYMLFNVFIVGTAALALWKGKGLFRYMQRASDTSGVVEEMGQGWRGMFYAVLAVSYLNAMVIEMLVVDHW